MAMVKTLVGLSFCTLLVACVHGNCRYKAVMPPYPGDKKALVIEQKTDIKTKGDLKPVERHLFVYKYDGSQQCAQKKGQSLHSMEKKLAGLKVFSRNKKSDGLMHIQVCGSNTGMANVYEILAKDLGRAKERGFQLWKFE